MYRPTEAQANAGALPTDVVLVSRSDAALARARATGLWKDLASDGGRPWTDDYSNIVGAMLAKVIRR
jgi:hypothetical protein